jgi:hypothetical protein
MENAVKKENTGKYSFSEYTCGKFELETICIDDFGVL